MASGNAPRPMYSNVLNVTNADPTNWELVQANVRENCGVVVRSVILKCLNDMLSNTPFINLGTTFLAYAFTTVMVTSNQWDNVPTRILRAYINANGNVSCNTQFTAGEYITITFALGNNI